jgi:hypothetical protein
MMLRGSTIRLLCLVPIKVKRKATLTGLDCDREARLQLEMGESCWRPAGEGGGSMATMLQGMNGSNRISIRAANLSAPHATPLARLIR